MNTPESTAQDFVLPAELRMAILGFCEFTSDVCLGFEPDLQRDLLTLENKIIRFEVTDLSLKFFISLSGGRLRFFEAYTGEPDTRISLDSVNAFRLFKQRGSTPVNVQLDIRGDIQTGQRLKQIIDGYQFDWNEKLSYFCGDIMAQQIANRIGHISGYLHTTVRGFFQTSAEYLVEEKQMLAHKIALLEFTEAVVKIRNDVDRAEARLQQLRRVL